MYMCRPFAEEVHVVLRILNLGVSSCVMMVVAGMAAKAVDVLGIMRCDWSEVAKITGNRPRPLSKRKLCMPHLVILVCMIEEYTSILRSHDRGMPGRRSACRP
jgi:hypothetical protein